MGWLGEKPEGKAGVLVLDELEDGGRLGDELFMFGEAELGVPNEKLGEGSGPGMRAGTSRVGMLNRA